MQIDTYLAVVFLSMLPVLELRAGILFGLSQGLNPFNVFMLAVATNAIVGVLVLWALNNILPFIMKIRALKDFYNFSILRTRKHYKPYIDKYGATGLALFIAVPLPGTGSWTGALAAFLIGMEYKRFAIVNIVGVTIAGIIVTLAGLGVIALFF